MIRLIYRKDQCLRAIRIRTSIRHRQETRTSMAQLEILILESITIDRMTACSITSSEITSLDHKVLYVKSLS